MASTETEASFGIAIKRVILGKSGNPSSASHPSSGHLNFWYSSSFSFKDSLS